MTVFLQALLEGYRKEYEMDAVWERRIWGFVRLRRLETHAVADAKLREAPWFGINRAHFSAHENLV